eukprot:4983972-Lingulodinium_polyedra.AAC.1
MEFAKHSAKTYREVRELSPSYAKWSAQAAKEGGDDCPPELLGFVLWLNTAEVTGGEEEPAPVKTQP